MEDFVSLQKNVLVMIPNLASICKYHFFSWSKPATARLSAQCRLLIIPCANYTAHCLVTQSINADPK